MPWIIYTLARPPDAPYFVGIIDPDGNADEPDDATMSIYGTAETEAEAKRHRDTLIKRYNIAENAQPIIIRSQLVPRVKCDQTGATYSSIRAAARANNVDKRALSVHLQDRGAVPSVKGLTFKRINND